MPNLVTWALVVGARSVEIADVKKLGQFGGQE